MPRQAADGTPEALLSRVAIDLCPDGRNGSGNSSDGTARTCSEGVFFGVTNASGCCALGGGSDATGYTRPFDVVKQVNFVGVSGAGEFNEDERVGGGVRELLGVVTVQE